MKEREILKELKDIGAELHTVDLYPFRQDDGTYLINEHTGEAVSRLLMMFRRLSWQIQFNAYKELRQADDTRAINPLRRKPGSLVKVRSCRPEHGDKTYLGILIGDVSLAITHSIAEDGAVSASYAYHNPAIIIPELGEIVYGYESWWGVIESREDLDKLITDETIANVWYVKLLADGFGKPVTTDTGKGDNT